jgi:hypothetical protein
VRRHGFVKVLTLDAELDEYSIMFNINVWGFLI